jgi:hypothetical protein
LSTRSGSTSAEPFWSAEHTRWSRPPHRNRKTLPRSSPHLPQMTGRP